jgi:alpha-L-rhamnosidase
MSVFLCISAILLSQIAGTFVPVRLRVEYLDSPISIDVSNPRFSWALSSSSRNVSQSSYLINVTSSNGDVIWSNKVNSNQSQNVVYAGAPLVSDADYSWTVVVWDQNDMPSTSATSTFSTAALRNQEDFQNAQFIIGQNQETMLRTEFTISSEIVRARLWILGLGNFKASINGNSDGFPVLGSFTTFSKRVLYEVVDVKDKLRVGCNAIGVMLGNGWYAQHSIKEGTPSLLMYLSVTTVNEGKVVLVSSTQQNSSSLLFTSAPSPVTSNDMYIGEAYDANLYQPGWDACNFKPTSPWTPAILSTSTPGNGAAIFNSHTIPIIREEDYVASSIYSPFGNAYVFDFGQNMAGQLTFCSIGVAGTTAFVSVAETVHRDGSIWNQYGARVAGTINFTFAGTGNTECFSSHFVYYGFRYAQIEGLSVVPDESTLVAHFIHSKLARTGSFVSSNSLLNAIKHATQYAALSNLVDIPTDCPQRERRGYLGDGQVSCETNIYLHDMPAFYTKWLRDIVDVQYPSGELTDTAPYYSHGKAPGDPAWTEGYPLVLKWMHDYYEDPVVIEKNYEPLLKFVDYTVAQGAANGTDGLYTFQIYGDWGSAYEGIDFSPYWKTPDQSAYFFIKGLDIAAWASTLVGNVTGASYYSNLASQARTAYTSVFFNPQNSSFLRGYPINQLLALDLGGVIPSGSEAAVLDVLVNDIIQGLPHYNVSGTSNFGGIVTTKLIYDVLQRNGRTDLSLQMHMQTSSPSYGFWVEQGFTTLVESWNDEKYNPISSLNHIMFGGGYPAMFHSFGGIDRRPGSIGWHDLLFEPFPSLPNLTFAQASIDSPLGLISSDWSMNLAGAGNVCGGGPERSKVLLQCLNDQGQIGSGVFTNVTFASFGTPGGSCGAYVIDPTCHSAVSQEVVSQLCIGQTNCTIDATVQVFGKTDPCPGFSKSLAVQLYGPECATITFSIATSVPPSAVGDISVPTLGIDPSSTSLFITESGIPIWQNGVYISKSTNGVSKAVVSPSKNAITFSVTSGNYQFQVYG